MRAKRHSYSEVRCQEVLTEDVLSDLFGCVYDPLFGRVQRNVLTYDLVKSNSVKKGPHWIRHVATVRIWDLGFRR